MLQLRQPGVYLQELPSGAHSIVGSPTSVALFVGPTGSGIDRRPTQLFNFGDFSRAFGGLAATSNLSYSVLHFFANGGGEAWVTRVKADGAVPASSQFKAAGGSNLGLTVAALSSGPSGNNLFLEYDPFDIGANPFAANPDVTKFNLSVIDAVGGGAERWASLSTSSADTRSVDRVVNKTGSGSQLIGLTVGPASGGNPPAAPKPTGSIYAVGALAGGAIFAKPVRVTLRLTPLTAAGANGTPVVLDVTAFAIGATVPRTRQELAARLVNALNGAARADTVFAPNLQRLALDAGLFEGATLLRLRLGAAPATGVTGRINDAIVELVDKAKDATNDSLFDLFDLTSQSVNVSRYQLGLPYGELLAAPVVGINGQPHGQPSDDDFLAAVQALETPDPFFNTLCLPDLVRATPTDANTPLHANAQAVYAEAARICELKHALLLVDAPPGVKEVNGAANWKSLDIGFQSTFAAAFFPDIEVDDPLIQGAIRSHPPSGAIAGVIARTDGAVGVWQAPAGTDASISGAYGPSQVLSDAEHGVLNPLGLNVIRQFPIFGTVNFGSRTLMGADAMASEWKYLPVRRTASYILRSLGDGLKWAVHKPNGDQLWMQLRMSVNSFMQTLFRQGAFKGTSAADAYFVKCDAETTTSTDLANGIVNILVGFAPLRPAEFVVVSLRQIVQPNQ